MTRIMRQKQKDQFRSAAYVAGVPTPSKLRTRSKLERQSAPVPQRSSLRVCFQHTQAPIDLTKLRTKGDSENESFLSILGFSSDE